MTNITYWGKKNLNAEQEMDFEFESVIIVGTNWVYGACCPIQSLWQEVQVTPVAQETI